MTTSPGGERVADGVADAGGRPAKGLNLCRVIVRLVLKQQQPVLRPVLCINLDADGAGIDFLALLHLRQQALLAQGFGRDGGNIH